MPDTPLKAGEPMPAWEARIKELIREVLREDALSVPPHVREANHLFINEVKEELHEFLKAERLRRERREDIRRKVLGGLILMIASAVGTFLLWVFTVAYNAISHPAAQDAAQHLDKLPPR